MDNVEYVVKSEYNQDVRSAFINKETVNDFLEIAKDE